MRDELQFPGWVYAVILVVAVLVTFVQCHESNDCEARGGAYLRTAFGYSCVQAVRP